MQRIFAAAFAVLIGALCAQAALAQDPVTGPAPPAAANTPPGVAVSQSNSPTSPATPPDPTAVPAAVAGHPAALDRADLAAYVDGLVDAGMEREGIAGVTIEIVDRNGPLLSRGYGFASQGSATQGPARLVSPDRTLFRIGSISKTFTYLLALQLVDEGKLDLDKPVNDYLPPDLRLPDDGYAPVLVRHLFTHSAGYEDSALGHLFADRADRVLTLTDYLQRHRPKRVREPGTHAVYSNYSVALLGALVAHVRGVGFDALAERELFTPMGMDLTTFREPLTAADPRNVQPRFKGLWSDGFQRSAGGFTPQAFEYVAQIGPAGGVSSTASDMGRFMRMLLGGGELDGTRVLSSSAYAHLAGAPLFRNAPQVPGFTFGFFDSRFGRVRAIGHGGATNWFHSSMTVVPELGIGIFVSTNTDTGRRFAQQVPEKVLERYFAAARPAALPTIPKDFDASRFAGKYAAERTNYSSAEKLFLATIAQVSAADDHSLVVSVGGDATRWVPEGGLSFREAEGPGRIAFLTDRSGAITGFASAGGHNVFARIGLFDAGASVQMAIAAAAAIALLVLAGAWLRRSRRMRDKNGARRGARVLYLTALAWIVFAVLVVAVVSWISNHEIEAFYTYPGKLLPIALWLAPLLIALSVACVLLLWPVWRARDWTVWRKLRHTAAALAFALAAYLLWHWNLVGWKL